MKSLDLKSEHFQHRPAAHPVLKPRQIKGIPGVRGTLPLQPGEVVLTQNEKEKLKKFGWKEGDPLPGNIAELMAKAQREVADDIRTAKPFKDHPVLKMAEPVDISSLTPEKRNELEGYLHQFKTMAPQIEAAAKNQANINSLAPEIQKAIHDAGGGIEVVDSREEEEDPASKLQRKIDEAEGRKEPRDQDGDGLEEDEESKKAESQTGLTSEHKNCPRCNWALSTKMIEPSHEDKLTYVTAILGDQSFCKEYSLYGGKLTVGFRQIATDRSDLAFQQVAHEIRIGLLSENTYRQLMVYRMLLSLNYIAVGDQTPVDFSGAVDRFIDSDDGEIKQTDVLPVILSRLQKTEPLKSESIWRACREAFERFNTLLDDLDARADSPDFWRAIEV